MDWNALPVKPHADVCLYALAMDLRSASDGSADPAVFGPAHYCGMRDYLRRRLDAWGESRSLSEEVFRCFLLACIQEAEQGAPWLFQEAPA